MIAWIVFLGIAVVVFALAFEFAVLATTLLIIGALVSTEHTLGYIAAGLIVVAMVWIKTASAEA